MPILAALALLPKDPLILEQKGELPIVISAPHGGRLAIPDCPLRVNSKLPQFVTVLDTSSDKLAEEIAAETEKLLGKKPWLIVAKFSRKYVDANRSAENGVESESGRKVYQQYHDALRQAVDSSRTEPRALLLDIHSQGENKERIYRGTNNFKSLSKFKKTSGLDLLLGPKGFLGTLESQSITIFPPCSAPTEKEASSFNGGYITQHYGSSHEDGIDAIQLEVGASYRKKDTLTATAKAIARAIKAHLDRSSK